MDTEGNKIKVNIEENADINNTQTPDTEESFDYDFLKEADGGRAKSTDEMVENQFDTAFKASSPVIQNYIISDKLEENVRLICKIEKLDDEKSRVIVENIAVSLLVGLLPISEAKNTIIESFRSSGVLLEPLTAGMILKNIDAYILSDIRKQILESKIESNKEIRHLTLKEKNEEKEKEELRKILLERTGTLTGKGEVLVQYKNREIKQTPEIQNEDLASKKDFVLNRESLLAKINMQNVSDADKIRDRMLQIKKEEEERIKRDTRSTEKEEEEKIKRIQNREEMRKEEVVQETPENNVEDNSVSQEFAKALAEKLSLHEDEKADLDNLRKQRGEDEAKTQTITAYSRMINGETNGGDYTGSTTQDFDPYRENI